MILLVWSHVGLDPGRSGISAVVGRNPHSRDVGFLPVACLVDSPRSAAVDS